MGNSHRNKRKKKHTLRNVFLVLILLIVSGGSGANFSR